MSCPMLTPLFEARPQQAIAEYSSAVYEIENRQRTYKVNVEPEDSTSAAINAAMQAVKEAGDSCK